MKFRSAGLILISWLSAVQAEPLPSPGTIGLLEVSGLFGRSLCDPVIPDPIPVHSAPESAEPVGEIRLEQVRQSESSQCSDREVRIYWHRSESSKLLITEEVSYEQPGAVVTERQNDWFRIFLTDRFAWVKPSGKVRFYPLQELYQTQLTYLSSAWDGRFCSYPGQFRQCIQVSSDQKSAPAVRIVDSMTLRGQKWLQVRLVSRGACNEGEELIPSSEGWIPAYGMEDKPTVWFYSRNC